MTTRGWGDRHPASEEVTEENLLVSVRCQHGRPVAEVHQTSHGIYGWAATPAGFEAARYRRIDQVNGA